MASTINATTSGVVTTGDSVATLSLQTGGTTAVAIDSAQIVSLSKSLALLGSTSGSVALAAPATAGTQSYTLPTAQPTADGLALTATKIGAMSWAAVSATPAGSDTQVQYNSGGTAFGAASTFTFNNSTGVVTATGFSGALNGTVGATTPAAGTFTTATARAAATQDSVVLQGRAGGTGSYAATITPTTLTASRTVTLPDANINFATGLPVANGGTGATTANSAFNALAPSQTSNSGKYLTTDGSNTSWATVSGGGSPAGANTQIQYNSGGSSFGAASTFVYTGNLGVGTSTPSASDFNGSATVIQVNKADTNGGLFKASSSTASVVLAAGNNLAYLSTTTASPLVFQTNVTESCRIDTNQYLLIGYTTSNGAYRLQVNSQIYATNAIIATSDARYKKDVTPVTDGLTLVNKLNPVSFNWKPHEVHNFDTVNTDVGFIAQEVQSALAGSPYLSNIVKSNETTLPDESKEEFLGVADGKLIPILVKAIQELSTALDAANARIAALEAK